MLVSKLVIGALLEQLNNSTDSVNMYVWHAPGPPSISNSNRQVFSAKKKKLCMLQYQTTDKQRRKLNI